MFVEEMNEHLHSETGPPRSYSSRKAQAPWKEGKLVKVCSLVPVEHSGTHHLQAHLCGSPVLLWEQARLQSHPPVGAWSWPAGFPS